MKAPGVHIQEFEAFQEAKKTKQALVFALGSPDGSGYYKIRPVPNSFILELCWTEGDRKAEEFAGRLECFLDGWDGGG
jgi:hypothetical protein